MQSTTRPTTLETRLEATVRGAFTWLEEWIVSLIRVSLFILSLPGRILPTLLHVAAFTTILPALLAVSLGAGIAVVNRIPEGWNVDLWMQYGEQATPFARATLPHLSPGQPYDIFLSLDVPVTPDNVALGNFMTRLILTDAKNSTVASANRPALVLKHTRWTPFFAATPSIETITVPLVESWSPPPQPGTLSSTGVSVARGTVQKGFHAFISVGRPDSWKSLGVGQGKELAIARAVLHGRVKLSGVWGFFARHRIILFMLTTSVFFSASTSVALILYLLFAPKLSEDHEGETATKPSSEEQGLRTPKMRVKAGDTEPPLSETESSWTSGGPTRIKAESDDDVSSTSS